MKHVTNILNEVQTDWTSLQNIQLQIKTIVWLQNWYNYWWKATYKHLFLTAEKLITCPIVYLYLKMCLILVWESAGNTDDS